MKLILVRSEQNCYEQKFFRLSFRTSEIVPNKLSDLLMLI